MKLRDEAHKALDELDSRSLGVVYDQIRLILDMRSRAKAAENQPAAPDKPEVTREMVLRMTASDTSNWAYDIIAEREDRV